MQGTLKNRYLSKNKKLLFQPFFHELISEVVDGVHCIWNEASVLGAKNGWRHDKFTLPSVFGIEFEKNKIKA